MIRSSLQPSQPRTQAAQTTVAPQKPLDHPVMQLQAGWGNQATNRALNALGTVVQADSLHASPIQRKPIFRGLSHELIHSSRQPLAEEVQRPMKQALNVDLQDVKVHTPEGRQLPAQVVQQTQGQIQPTTQIDGLSINDNTKLEQAADAIAHQVTHAARESTPEFDQAEPAPSISTSQPVIQRMAIPKGEVGVKQGSLSVTPHLEASIQQAKGGGQPLAQSIRTPMEQAFGADFSGVKVHSDSQADALSRSISARAFTTGEHIFFKQGEYNSTSKAGQELLAHELTHTIQQKDAGIQHQIVQRQVDTMGGTWKTNTYKKAEVEGRPGAEIEIEFKPNDFVDSEKIALLQKVEKVLNGENTDQVLKDREQKGKLVSGGEQTKASRTDGIGHWDRLISQTNPVYGAPDLEPDAPISETPKSKLNMSDKAPSNERSNYQLGYSYKPPGLFKMRKKRNAKLWDKPNMAAGPGSHMLFETTAMSIEGAQKNVYYGSVRWGWKINNAATGVELDPPTLQVVKQGTPSAEMQRLADVWNQATTYTNNVEKTNTQIPTTGHSTKLSEAQLNNIPDVVQAIDQLETELMQPGLAENDKNNKEFELKFLKRKLEQLGGVVPQGGANGGAQAPPQGILNQALNVANPPLPNAVKPPLLPKPLRRRKPPLPNAVKPPLLPKPPGKR